MKPVEIRDLYAYSFYGGLKTCGGSTVFVRARANEENNAYDNDLMLYKDGSITQLTDRGNVSGFVFENENTIWFAQPEQEGAKTSLWTLRLNGGEALRRTTLERGGLEPVGFTENGQMVVSIRAHRNWQEKARDAHDGDYEVLDESPWYFNGAGFVSGVRTHLYLYDPKTNALGACLSEGLRISQTAIHKNHLFLTASEDTGRVMRSGSDRLYSVDLSDPADPKREELWNCRMDVYTLNAADGRLLLFGSDAAPIGLNSNPNLYEYAFAEKAGRRVLAWSEALGNTVGTDCAVVGGNDTCLEQGRLCFTGTIVSHTNLFCLDGAQLHQLLEWPGTIHSFGYCQGDLMFIGARPGELQELYTFKDGEVRCLSEFQTQMKDTYVAQAKPVFYTGCLHTQQMGWVLYPRDFDPEKSYPGILDIHGGPKTVYGTIFYHEMQVWASRGYFVFFCNPFGSDGQGNEYADIRGKYGTVDFEDLMAFTDAVLEQVPQIDRERLGVTGGSYGGFMTNWIIGHTDRFRAAASQRSISNWISFLGTSDIAPDFVTDQVGCSYEDLRKLWKHSPLSAADQVKTPTLFIHSDEDYRCPIEQGYQMLNALLNNGVEARMVLFHKENHDLSRTGRPVHRVRRLQEITDWMDRHVKGNNNEA